MLPSDRARPELKAISVAAQQLLIFTMGDDRSINTKNQVFFGIKLPFIHQSCAFSISFPAHHRATDLPWSLPMLSVHP